MAKKETKHLEDMSIEDLSAYIRKLGKPRIRKLWSGRIETVYPPGYCVACGIIDRKMTEADIDLRLKKDAADTQLSRNRAERANLDQHSRAIEPLPDHHHVHHEV